MTGWFDSLNIWPAIGYTVAADSILFSLFRFNRALESQGVYHEQIFRNPFANNFYGILYFAMSLCSTVIFIYLLYRIGLWYLLWLPAVVVGSIPAGVIVGATPYAQYIYPLVYVAVITFLVIFLLS